VSFGLVSDWIELVTSCWCCTCRNCEEGSGGLYIVDATPLSHLRRQYRVGFGRICDHCVAFAK